MNSRTYTSRQRVLDTLNRREPDRIPFDLGSSIETGMTAQAYQGLLELLGLTEEPDETLPNLFLTAAGIAQIPENILHQLKVDVRGSLIQLPSEPEPELGFENETTLVYHDEWGIKWAKPPSSLYMDPVGAPLKGELTVERLARYPWPNPDQEGRYTGLRKEVERLRDTGCAVMFSLYGLGILDMALMIHGIEDTLMDMAANPAVIEDLLDRITEFQMRMWTNTLEILGDNVDVCLHSDDLGSQTTSLISPEMYRRLLKPRHAELFAHVKKSAKTDVKLLLHSCGSVRSLIPDLIEIGIDALNPIQVGAVNMDTKQLKSEFGSELSFWGGGIDTQKVLPHGSISEVKDEVKRRIDDLAPGGGFVFAAVHNIQPDVPPENIRAMWEAFQEHCSY